ncbi:putative Ig domain-containing protein [Azospirillum sp.]|uniref:putative Ig domain-containing protein n=1 Tax=Azospirillum sp. TaxID=34012 RepID=UPI002D4DED68|nr:putative Ig domain-containing protein [Azospirillum sp.]HYD68291.1 putative Ig domain-containing protein [Azospirillum sp.]
MSAVTLTATLEDGRRLPSWLRSNTSSRTFSGRVPRIFAGLELKVTAIDPDGESVSQTYQITPVGAVTGKAAIRTMTSVLSGATALPLSSASSVSSVEGMGDRNGGLLAVA